MKHYVGALYEKIDGTWTSVDTGCSRICITSTRGGASHVVSLGADRRVNLNIILPLEAVSQVSYMCVWMGSHGREQGIVFAHGEDCSGFIAELTPNEGEKEVKKADVSGGTRVSAKKQVALTYDPELDADATAVSFLSAVKRVEEGLRAVLTAAHNCVINPAYNYDKRCESAIQYLHAAVRALIKLFVHKIRERRLAKQSEEKSMTEKIMRMTYYHVLNTPAAGKTAEFTLKAAVGIHRRTVLRILTLQLKDSFRHTIFVGHQMLSAFNAIKLIDNSKVAPPCSAEGPCMLQLCATTLELVGQLTDIADGMATFGTISRADHESSAPKGDQLLMGAPFWDQEPSFPPDARGYTLNQLIFKLTDDQSLDRKFMSTFLTTYQSFCAPEQLLDKLMERFRVPASFDAQRRQAIQLRVSIVLKNWCDMHFSQFDNSLLERINQFVTESLMREGHEHMARALNSFIQKKLEERAQAHAVGFRVPSVIFPPRHKENPRATQSPLALWYDYDVQRMAEMLTMIDFGLYQNVQAPELLNQAWNNRKLKWRAPNLLAMAKRSTALSYWITTCVLSQARVEQRVHMLDKFVQLGEALLKLNNYQSLMATLAGLNLSPIHRLKQHWAMLPKKHLKLWQKLNDLMSSDQAFKEYRAALDQSSLPAIPYVGVHLTDLFFKEDANPDTVDDAINYRKRELVYESIEHIQRFQAVPYAFPTDEPAMTFLRALPALQEEEAYELSLFYEPRSN